MAPPSASTFHLPLPKSRVLTGIAPLDTAPAPPGSSTTLPQLFEHQAKQRPNNIAFSCQTDHDLKAITYAEADSLASSLAEQILRLHSGRNDFNTKAPVVAVWLEKGLDLILAILATTYSGATWLPFDPDVPVDRAAVCVLDASVTAIICDAAHSERAHEVAQRVAPSNAENNRSLEIRTFADLTTAAAAEKAATSSEALQSRSSGPGASDAAYLIYTSGSTGTPKGIAIPHSAALVFCLSEREVLQTIPKDIVWNGFSPAFDMFVEEMWVTIAGGAHLAIGTREECRDVGGLPAIWKSRGVTVVNAVPTLIGIMGMSQTNSERHLLPSSIRLINLGGEACPPALVNRLARSGLRIINTYGPTETTVTATWDELQPDCPVTIGRPLPSYHACILPVSDDGSKVSLEPLELAEGTEGELAIGGPCVGLGYVGREELTTQKFLQHPLVSHEGQRLYRTGDRVRLQGDLKIAFIGRIDTQVKHRGFRIELGEIEMRLSSHPDVQAAAVILANADTDTARLEAFLVIRPEAEQDVTSIHQLAAKHLPAYMRPEEVYFIDSDEMPRLPSGKINNKALHKLSADKAAAAETSKSEAATGLNTSTAVDDGSPLSILLRTLAIVFPQSSQIGPDADFFDDLGGHSLLAAMLVSRLRQVQTPLDGSVPFVSIGLPDIYEGRTPANIATRFITSEKGDDRSDTLGSFDGQDDLEATGPLTGESWPVSPTRFVFCGMAQILPLLFLFFVHSVEILIPYLVFEELLRVSNVGWAILAAYGIFVAIPPCLALLAIAGKWLILGKAKEGEYPLYGLYYFRWWLAERLADLADPKLIADSVLYPYFLRAMGARVGKYCHLGSMTIGAACDLVEIGDDVVVGADVVLAVSVVERGRLILKRVVIGNETRIGSNSVIEGGASVDEAAEVGALSMVPDGMLVPSFQRYHGSPARLDRELKDDEAALGQKSRPSKPRAIAMGLGNMLIAGLVLPLLYLLPQIPGLMLFDVVDLTSVGSWTQVAVLSIPIAFAFQLLVFAQLILFRRLVLGRIKEGTYKIYSNWYLRKWFIDRVMDLSLDILHPVFATLYIVPFLKVLGVKIGRRAEVSNARGLNFELLEIGDESFVADSVLIGDTVVRGNELTLKKTKLEPRAFAGNASVLPQGTTLASGTLVGVLSIAPPLSKPLASNTSCFGSPPVFMPARHRIEGHDDNLLFRPSRSRIASRLLVEGLRIVVPRAIIVFGIGFGCQIAYTGYHGIGAVYTLLMLPLFYFFLFALPSILITACLKWILIGRYKAAEWPLWSLDVWLSEAITSTYETIAKPLLAGMLIGTPYLAWCFRLLGVKIGSRVTLLASDITEYDCVTIEDEGIINQHCGPQTHLFEDRVMKIGPVTLGKRACIKPYSICLPGSSLEDDAQLGTLSLVMKGETLPEKTAWEGAPVVPRAKRRKAARKGSCPSSGLSSPTVHPSHPSTPGQTGVGFDKDDAASSEKLEKLSHSSRASSAVDKV